MHFKLTAWPELAAPYHRTAYRRMLCDMSHRFVSFQHLVAASGLARNEVRAFLDMLEDKGLVIERGEPQPDSIFDQLKPLGGWLVRALTTEIGGRR